MTRLICIALGLVLLSSGVAGVHETASTGPGLVSADSPLYRVETVVDNIAVKVGVKSVDSVAQERAVEAAEMADNGNYEAAAQAAREVEQLAADTASTNIDGLQEAETILEDVQSAFPESAEYGIGTALDSVRAGMAGDNGKNSTRTEQGGHRG